jgi:hypothetical protein
LDNKIEKADISDKKADKVDEMADISDKKADII